MENKFKSKIWGEFWDNHNLLSKDADAVHKAEELGSELIEMTIKEAVGKLPFNKVMPADKMKIKTLDIDFSVGTKIKLNNMIVSRSICNITNLVDFKLFYNLELIKISYINYSESIYGSNPLALEDELYNTNLFSHFQKLKKIILTEICYDGDRIIEYGR